MAKSLIEYFAIKAGDVVSIVGAGGKTSLLYRLGKELADNNVRVLLTSSTRIGYPSQDVCDTVVCDDNYDRLYAKLQDCFQRQHQVVALHEVERVDKAHGLPISWIDKLHQSNLCDVIVLEADGARKRKLKTHNETEPVIPTSTSLVIPVIPASAFGMKVQENSIHRMERFQALTGLKEGDTITPVTIATLLSHDHGYCRANPAACRYIPFLNVDSELPDKEVLQFLLDQGQSSNRFQRIVMASAVHREEPVTVWEL